MTILEARLRRYLFGTRCVQIFRDGEEVFGGDDAVVKLRRKHDGVRVWSLWSVRSHCCDDCDDLETDLEVMEWHFFHIDELRIER